MSAIAGVIGTQLSQPDMATMLATMKRRGPDGQGIYQQEHCALLHTRLAIIDPEGGSQPMRCSWNGEDYVIVYNGELYNTLELRNELTNMGHEFKTRSDTEVVLHAYMQWAEQSLDKFNGTFAFGVWHVGQRRLFLARDRIGVKPLFYHKAGGVFCFASEIKTILSCPNVRPQIDQAGVAQILLLGPGRIPGSGVFRDIEELMPGCYGVFEGGKWQWKRYWKLRDAPHEDSFEQTSEKVRSLVYDAINRQMVSDVPVGAFMSGGLDSSIICAIVSKEYARVGRTLETFSVSYEDHDKYFKPERFQPNADDHYIEIMHKHIGSNHNTTVLSPMDLIAMIDDATLARDLPGMGDVDFSLLAFGRDVAARVKVAVSGECADEIFGGYPWYRDPDIRAKEGFPWAQNTTFRASFMRPELLNQFDPQEYVMDHYRTTIHNSDILPESNSVDRRTKEMVNLNFDWFMQTLLDRNDRMSAYGGIEARVPFCDYRIAEYLYCVPWRYKDYNNREKGLLRHAMEGLLPQEVLYRKKSPFPKTYDPKYSDLVTKMLRDVVSDPASPILQIINRHALLDLMNADFEWPWYGQLMRRPQTIAYMLQINRWLQLYGIEII